MVDAAGGAGSDGSIGLIHTYLDDPKASWTVGIFGALAEFHRDVGEAVQIDMDERGGRVTTARGAVRISLPPRVKPVAYEVPSKRPGVWIQGVAICLPEVDATLPAPSGVLTEIGEDPDPARPEDRAGRLFDLGLGGAFARICVRTADGELMTALRRGCGQPFLTHANPGLGAVLCASPHRVFQSAIGRIEVYGPIPSPDETTPDTGPHTHILPELLNHGRTHAATVPIPDGLIPCAGLFPANPILTPQGDMRGFDRAAHGRFQELVERFGDPGHVVLKRRVRDAVEAGEPPIPAETLDRWSRLSVRVTLRQLVAMGTGGGSLKAWRAAFERPDRDA